MVGSKEDMVLPGTSASMDAEISAPISDVNAEPAPRPDQAKDNGGMIEPRLTAEPANASLAHLTAELARLRHVEAERDALLAHSELLRGANQNLVLATFDAQNLREEAETANIRQNEFLAMLAHELRNPLAPISMAGAILSKIASSTPQLSSVQKIIERQVSHLSGCLTICWMPLASTVEKLPWCAVKSA